MSSIRSPNRGLICTKRDADGRRGAHIIVRAVSSMGVFAVSGLISFLYYEGGVTLWQRHLSCWFVGASPFPAAAFCLAVVWQCLVILLSISYARVVVTDPGAVTQELSDELLRFASLSETQAAFPGITGNDLKLPSIPDFQRDFEQGGAPPDLEDGSRVNDDDDGDECHPLTRSDGPGGSPRIEAKSALELYLAQHQGPHQGRHQGRVGGGQEEGGEAHAPEAVPEREQGLLGRSQGLRVPPPLRLTHCRKCKALRPPRAHHCMICGRCIMKFFLLFVAYAFAACLLESALLLPEFLRASSGSSLNNAMTASSSSSCHPLPPLRQVKSTPPSRSLLLLAAAAAAAHTHTKPRSYFASHHTGLLCVAALSPSHRRRLKTQVLAFTLSLSVAFALLLFVVMHGSLVVLGVTTLELHGYGARSPFSLGFRANVRAVFGGGAGGSLATGAGASLATGGGAGGSAAPSPASSSSSSSSSLGSRVSSVCGPLLRLVRRPLRSSLSSSLSNHNAAAAAAVAVAAGSSLETCLPVFNATTNGGGGSSGSIGDGWDLGLHARMGDAVQWHYHLHKARGLNEDSTGSDSGGGPTASSLPRRTRSSMSASASKWQRLQAWCRRQYETPFPPAPAPPPSFAAFSSSGSSSSNRRAAPQAVVANWLSLSPSSSASFSSSPLPLPADAHFSTLAPSFDPLAQLSISTSPTSLMPESQRRTL